MQTEIQQGQHRTYLASFAAVLLLSLAAIATFNLWVDPYRLFGVFPETTWTAVKARPESNIGAIKLLNAIAARPQCVIIGNSRADIGFNPQHAGWHDCNGHVYNAAVPGAGIDRVRDDFRSIVERAPVKVALLAVDFQDFVINAGPVGSPSRHPARDPSRLLIEERAHALFTLTGLADSLGTLRAARQPHPASLRADGLNPLLDYIDIAAREGYPSMFRQRLNETAANYARARLGIYPAGAADSVEFELLRDILRIAREHGVELYVTTYPYHAEYYLLFDQLGLWGEFERWKRQLASTVADANSAPGAGPKAQLWDFATVSPLTTLNVEDTAERGAAKWYWEAGHFKQALGDEVLTGMLGSGAASTPRLGAHLTPDTVESWLQVQTVALSRYAEEQPEMQAEVAAALAQARAAQAKRQAK